MTRRAQIAMLRGAAVLAVLIAAGCRDREAGRSATGTSGSHAAAAISEPTTANSEPAPASSEPAPAGGAAHDPAHAPIDCPLRKHGIDPDQLRPFEDIEKYVGFLDRADRAPR